VKGDTLKVVIKAHSLFYLCLAVGGEGRNPESSDKGWRHPGRCGVSPAGWSPGGDKAAGPAAGQNPDKSFPDPRGLALPPVRP
jgi:hypothetical protein